MPSISVPWYRRNPRSSPVGLIALVLSVVGASAYIVSVARPVANGSIIGLLDDPTHNTEILIMVVDSGAAILLSFVSLALERAILPAFLALLVLAVVQKAHFLMMPIWTLMLGRWGLGWLYALTFTTALLLVFARIARKVKQHFAA